VTRALVTRALVTRALVTLAFVAFASACGSEPGPPGSSGGEGAQDQERRILRVAYDREIDVLNAFTSQNLVDISFSMVEGLVTTNEQNTYIPVLAKSIPTEENGLIVVREDGTIDMTWELHEGVRWHDGEPLTSADVCFTWRFVVSEASETYNREQYLPIVDCRTVGEHTVVFTWDGVYAYYAGLFEALLPEHVLGSMTTEEIVNYEPYNRGSQTIGTGPFRFAEWRAGEYIRVVRNDDYWRGTQYPAIDEIVWGFIPDNNTRLNSLKAGQYDFGRIEPVQVPEMASSDDYDVNLVSTNGLMHFDLSVTGERGRVLFGDREVRRALFQAIDRGAIANQLMEGNVVVAHTPINPSSPYHNPDVRRYDYDPDGARRMLDAAGWVQGSDGVRVKNGQRFEFVMINRAGSTDRIMIAQVIQAQLAAVGVAVTFETLESAAWTQRWRSEQWEGIVSAWSLPADPSLRGLYSCEGANNMTGQCDPELDAALLAADQVLDFETRKPLLDEAQQLLAEAAVSLPIYYNVFPEVVHKRIDGYRGSGTNFGSFWNLYEWTLGPRTR